RPQLVAGALLDRVLCLEVGAAASSTAGRSTQEGQRLRARVRSRPVSFVEAFAAAGELPRALSDGGDWRLAPAEPHLAAGGVGSGVPAPAITRHLWHAATCREAPPQLSWSAASFATYADACGDHFRGLAAHEVLPLGALLAGLLRGAGPRGRPLRLWTPCPQFEARPTDHCTLLLRAPAALATSLAAEQHRRPAQPTPQAQDLSAAALLAQRYLEPPPLWRPPGAECVCPLHTALPMQWLGLGSTQLQVRVFAAIRQGTAGRTVRDSAGCGRVGVLGAAGSEWRGPLPADEPLEQTDEWGAALAPNFALALDGGVIREVPWEHLDSPVPAFPVGEWVHLALRSNLENLHVWMGQQIVLESEHGAWLPIAHRSAGLFLGPTRGLEVTEVRVWGTFRTDVHLAQHQRQPLHSLLAVERRADDWKKVRIRSPGAAPAAAADGRAVGGGLWGLAQLLGPVDGRRGASTEPSPAPRPRAPRQRPGSALPAGAAAPAAGSEVVFPEIGAPPPDAWTGPWGARAPAKQLPSSLPATATVPRAAPEAWSLAEPSPPDPAATPQGLAEPAGGQPSSEATAEPAVAGGGEEAATAGARPGDEGVSRRAATQGAAEEQPASAPLQPPADTVRAGLPVASGRGVGLAGTSPPQADDGGERPPLDTAGAREAAAECELAARALERQRQEPPASAQQPPPRAETHGGAAPERGAPAEAPAAALDARRARATAAFLPGLQEVLPEPSPAERAAVADADASLRVAVRALERRSYAFAAAAFRAALEKLARGLPTGTEAGVTPAARARFEAASSYGALCSLMLRQQGAQPLAAPGAAELIECWACALRLTKAPRHTVMFAVQAMASLFAHARAAGGCTAAGQVAALLLRRYRDALSEAELEQAQYVRVAAVTGGVARGAPGGHGGAGPCPRCGCPLTLLAPACGDCGAEVAVCYRRLRLCDSSLATVCSLCAAVAGGGDDVAPQARRRSGGGVERSVRASICTFCGVGELRRPLLGDPW
ncbi:unnamed protein product, partial [Prorocentrum cordatum]